MMDLLQSSVILSNSDKDEFFEGILGGERSFFIGDFPQLEVQSFNGVSGVNEPSDLGAEVEHSAQAHTITNPPITNPPITNL